MHYSYMPCLINFWFHLFFRFFLQNSWSTCNNHTKLQAHLHVWYFNTHIHYVLIKLAFLFHYHFFIFGGIQVFSSLQLSPCAGECEKSFLLSVILQLSILATLIVLLLPDVLNMRSLSSTKIGLNQIQSCLKMLSKIMNQL